MKAEFLESVIRKIDDVAGLDEIDFGLVGCDGGSHFVFAKAAWRDAWEVTEECEKDDTE